MSCDACSRLIVQEQFGLGLIAPALFDQLAQDTPVPRVRNLLAETDDRAIVLRQSGCDN
jgi:hypothetical protein